MFRESTDPAESSVMERSVPKDVIADCKMATLFQCINFADKICHILSCWAGSLNVHFSSIVSCVTQEIRLDVNFVWF